MTTLTSHVSPMEFFVVVYNVTHIIIVLDNYGKDAVEDAGSAVESAAKDIASWFRRLDEKQKSEALSTMVNQMQEYIELLGLDDANVDADDNEHRELETSEDFYYSDDGSQYYSDDGASSTSTSTSEDTEEAADGTTTVTTSVTTTKTTSKATTKKVVVTKVVALLLFFLSYFFK